MERRQPETACGQCGSGIEGLVTVDWAAAYLRVTRARVYKLCDEKLLPHCRQGRNIRLSPRQVIAWAESGGKSYPGGWRKEPVR